jgi:hypothetical protein
VDAVGADQHVAARRPGRAAGAVDEGGRDPALIGGEGGKATAGADRARAEPLLDRPVDDPLQASAVDGELRHVVAGVDPARLAPDLLAEAVRVDQLARADRGGVELVEKTQPREFLDGVRQGVDADPELPDRLGLLVDLAGDPAPVQHQGRREPADAAADDDGFHGASFQSISPRRSGLPVQHARRRVTCAPRAGHRAASRR